MPLQRCVPTVFQSRRRGVSAASDDRRGLGPGDLRRRGRLRLLRGDGRLKSPDSRALNSRIGAAEAEMRLLRWRVSCRTTVRKPVRETRGSLEHEHARRVWAVCRRPARGDGNGKPAERGGLGRARASVTVQQASALLPRPPPWRRISARAIRANAARESSTPTRPRNPGPDRGTPTRPDFRSRRGSRYPAAQPSNSPSAPRVTRVRAGEASSRQAASVPRLALRVPAEAAEAIGCSPDFFDEHVRPGLRLVRQGRLVLVSVHELERWLESNSARTLGDVA
jgi:hypothetical protein